MPRFKQMRASPFNILISSAGRRVALQQCFQRALAGLGVSGRVFAADMQPLSAAFHSADRGMLVPRCTSPGFVARIEEICAEGRVRLVIPTIDTELGAYARARARLAAAGVTVAISDLDTVGIAGDKVRTHEWLTSKGFPTVQQHTLASVRADPNLLPLPYIAKPRFGSSAVGVRLVETPRQLAALPTEEDYLVQEVATGQEYTVDVYVDRRGRCRCAVPRRRIEVRGGEVSKAVTERVPAIIDLCVSLAESLPGASGTLCIQVFFDPASAALRVIEINPRFGGGFPLSDRAGADLARWTVEEALGQPCSATPEAWEAGVVMLRYDDAVFVRATDVGL